MTQRSRLLRVVEAAERLPPALQPPFWGALLWWMMPPASGARYRLWLRPACCPLLPWAFLASASGGPGCRLDRRAVPWASCRETLVRLGLPTGSRSLRREGFRRLGLRGVAPAVRAAWLEGLSKGVDFSGRLCHDVPELKEGVQA